MVRVEIVKSLVKEILKTFPKTQAHKILDTLESLETNPHKGKLVGTVGGVAIKELKHKKFRFYCIYDGYTLQALDEEKLVDLLLRFVRMSEKRNQQQVIEEIREILLKIGPSGFR